MNDPPEARFNRTGALSGPLSVHSIQSYADEQSFFERTDAEGRFDGEGIAAIRADYVRRAERLGSVPMPLTLTGAFTNLIFRLGGRNPEVLVDKLGERLAFERSSVRQYQALIDKAEALAGGAASPFTVDDLRRLRSEELQHMHIVGSALDGLGADPTAQTPSADVCGLACSGVMQVLTDPRTTLCHCLVALQAAELMDGAGWRLLIHLAREAGQDDLVAQFRYALDKEEEHARLIGDWLEKMIVVELG